LTVASSMDRWEAIALFDNPSATRSAICASRFVNDPSNERSPPDLSAARLKIASATSGEHGLSPRAACSTISTSWRDDASHERNPDTPAPAKPRRSSSRSGATSATTRASPAAEAISRATVRSRRWMASTMTTSGCAPARSREEDSAVLAAPASLRASSVAISRERHSRYRRMSEATKTRTLRRALIYVPGAATVRSFACSTPFLRGQRMIREAMAADKVSLSLLGNLARELAVEGGEFGPGSCGRLIGGRGHGR
jgi:hypothetical protein